MDTQAYGQTKFVEKMLQINYCRGDSKQRHCFLPQTLPVTVRTNLRVIGLDIERNLEPYLVVVAHPRCWEEGLPVAPQLQQTVLRPFHRRQHL